MSLSNVICNKCKKISNTFVYSPKLGMVVCKECKTDTGEYVSGRRGIYDSTGRLRDREWLTHKLDITSTEKKWHEDIKSRKVLPNGTVTRVKR